jgi:hypothetical protein
MLALAGALLRLLINKKITSFLADDFGDAIKERTSRKTKPAF